MKKTILINTVYEERVVRRISRKALSDECNISYNGLYKIENGTYNPSVKVAILISDALGIEVGKLFKIETV